MNPDQLKQFSKVHNAKREKKPFNDEELKRLIVRAMFCDLCPTLNAVANLYKLKLEYILHKEGISVSTFDNHYGDETTSKLFEEARNEITRVHSLIIQQGELEIITKDLGFDVKRL